MENCLFIFTNEYGTERITFRKGRNKKYEKKNYCQKTYNLKGICNVFHMHTFIFQTLK